MKAEQIVSSENWRFFYEFKNCKEILKIISRMFYITVSNYKGLEMECTTIKMGFESRPRTSGLRFSINVGGLFLRDKITEGSILPVLISPQTRVSNLHTSLVNVNCGSYFVTMMPECKFLSDAVICFVNF